MIRGFLVQRNEIQSAKKTEFQQIPFMTGQKRFIKKRVLIVDDHPFLRKGLSDFLDSQPDLACCGDVGTPNDAMEFIAKTKPDIVLADLNLPGKGGMELIKDIRALHPELPIIVLTMHVESEFAKRSVLAGARGYVAKSEPETTLLAAIRQVLNGKLFVSEQLAGHLIEHFAGGGVPSGPDSPSAHLTDRELQVFTLVGQASRTRDIAAELHISIKTVEAHRANIKQKLGITTSQELTRAAVRWVESRFNPRPQI